MRDGFLRVAASTPEVKVADVQFNREEICRKIQEGRKNGVKIMVFPELCLTAYTCGDLFLQKSLLTAVKRELKALQTSLREAICWYLQGFPGSTITSFTIQRRRFRTEGC